LTILVTGATGFVGSAVLRRVLAAGLPARALVRPGGDRRNLAGLPVELAEGDLGQPETLKPALEGCRGLFHVAADYRFWVRDPAALYRANVDGSSALMRAAASAGVERIVYTSSVATLGFRADGRPGDETTPSDVAGMLGHYKRSKFLAEEVVRELAGAGLPAVIVNPSAPVGPRDVKPTPTGQVIVDFLNKKIPAYLETGLNWVHVRDVAAGHILAAQKGTLGERYILGSAQGNWTMEETLKVLEEITGIAAPKTKIPHWVALAAAHVNEGTSFFTKTPPKAPLAGVRMAKEKMWFNPQKAIRDLGLPQTPPKQAFADAVEWFRKNGYVNK